MKFRLPNGEWREYGIKEFYDFLRITCAETAKECQLEYQEIDKEYPALAWDFWLKIIPEKTRFEITSLKEVPDDLGGHFVAVFQYTYYDGQSSSGAFAWYPAKHTIPQLKEKFEEIRAYYS